jgi:hypothetical protein
MVVTSPGLEARQEAQMRLAIRSISRIIAAACVWAPSAAFAQAPESSEVVPKGGFHFESGISYEGDTVGGDRSRSVGAPGALLRLGLGFRSEVRIAAQGLISEASRGVRTSGYSDIEVGAKFRLFSQDQIGVDLALMPMVTLPTGADAFTAGAVDPVMTVAWARELPAGFALTGNVNAGSVSDDGGRYQQQSANCSLAHSLVAGWDGYLQADGFTRLERDGGRAITFTSGVTRAVGDNSDFEFAAGRGLTDAAPDWFVGFAFSIRGPLLRR